MPSTIMRRYKKIQRIPLPLWFFIWLKKKTFILKTIMKYRTAFFSPFYKTLLPFHKLKKIAFNFYEIKCFWDNADNENNQDPRKFSEWGEATSPNTPMALLRHLHFLEKMVGKPLVGWNTMI